MRNGLERVEERGVMQGEADEIRSELWVAS